MSCRMPADRHRNGRGVGKSTPPVLSPAKHFWFSKIGTAKTPATMGGGKREERIVRVLAAFLAGVVLAGGGVAVASSSSAPATHLDVAKVDARVRQLQMEVYSLCNAVQKQPITTLCYVPR